METPELASLFALDSGADLPPPDVSPAYNLSSLRFLEGIHRPRSEALKAFLAENGWPTSERFGEEFEEAAFLVALHSDYDPEFQLFCHQVMLQLARRGKIRLGYLAFLTDRILCNRDKHQRFGTQIREVANGCFVPKPIENPERVDALRAQAGLTENLADYFQRVNAGDVMPHPVMEEMPQEAAEKILPFPLN